MSLTFAYRARTPSGERVNGTMRALDRGAALALLRERMLIPSSLESTTSSLWLGGLLRRRAPAERLAFFRAYAALERAGVDFSTAFDLLIAQSRTARFRDALGSIKADVERGGERLWTAMSHRPDDFTDLEVAMVAAGEEAGNREEIFDRLAIFLERDERLRKKVQAALLYPALVLITAFCVSLYLVAFVVPQFAKLFASFGLPLSPATGLIVDASAVVLNPFVVVALLATLGLAGIAAAKALRTTEGALAFDALRQRAPLVGEALRKTIVARLCRVLAALLQSGVNAVRALEVAVPVAESPLFARAVESARDRLAGGVCATLDEALADSGTFPRLVLGFVRVGGSAGNVPTMLAKIAEYYEEDVESLLSAFPTLIQTAVTLALGVVVAVIVYVVYVPLSQLGTSIH